jgi:hypothetical protein
VGAAVSGSGERSMRQTRALTPEEDASSQRRTPRLGVWMPLLSQNVSGERRWETASLFMSHKAISTTSQAKGDSAMQAYWGNPDNKNFILTLMVEEHEGFPRSSPQKLPLGAGGSITKSAWAFPCRLPWWARGSGGAHHRAMLRRGRRASLIRSGRIRTCLRWSGR